MQAPRLGRVALEDLRVVLRGGDELDHVQAALEREVRERRLRRVVPLVEEDELRAKLVEQRLRRERRPHGDEQRLAQQPLRVGAREIDAPSCRARETVETTKRPTAAPSTVSCARSASEGFASSRRGGLVARPGIQRGVDVVVEHDEAPHAERPQEARRGLRARLDEEDRRVALQLERLREHRLELELVDELRQADDERDRPGAVRERSERPPVPKPHEREIELAARLVVDSRAQVHVAAPTA